MSYQTLGETSFSGPPPDFSGDWDYIPPDPEDDDFDPDAPLPPAPPDPPQELMSLQPDGAIQWPEVSGLKQLVLRPTVLFILTHLAASSAIQDLH